MNTSDINITNLDSKFADMIRIKNKNNLDPKVQEYFNKFINLFNTQNDIDIKKNILEKLIKVFPKNYNLYFLMGYTFKDINQDLSLEYYKKCYNLNKKHVNNLHELGRILFSKGRYQDVINIVDDSYRDNSDILDNIHIKSLYAFSYIKDKKLEKAEKLMVDLINSFDENEIKSLIKNYDKNNDNSLVDLYFSSINNISYMYGDLGRYNKSIFYIGKIIDFFKLNKNVENEKKYIYSNLLVYYDYIYTNNTKNRLDIFSRFNELYEQDKLEVDKLDKVVNKNKTKLGYVSSDFIKHAVSNFIIPILKNHDKNKFDIILFDNSEHNIINVRSFINDSTIKIIKITHLDTDKAYDIIKSEKVDLLFDLNGHTDGNRLDIFAKKPSRKQISYIGYPNSTGIKSIDYRIVDNITDKNTDKSLYTEKLLFMPKCFLCYESYQQQQPVQIIDNGRDIILGSMNRENKNSIQLLKVWRDIFRKTKQLSLPVKIIIKVNANDDKSLNERKTFYKNMLEIKEDKEIILISSNMSTKQYFETFGKIDLLLDTFPYSGTTTSCNALYNSTPIVTLYKDNCHSHNVTSSILINSGLEELVAYTEDEYVDKVVEMCKDKFSIYNLKNSVHKKFQNLMDTKKFILDYENLINKIIL